MRTKLDAHLRKMAEPAPLKVTKALPRPDEAKKKRRGGRKARAEKESLEVSELHKLQNRMVFGEAEEEAEGFGDESIGMGMIGKGGSKVRLATDHKSKRTYTPPLPSARLNDDDRRPLTFVSLSCLLSMMPAVKVSKANRLRTQLLGRSATSSDALSGTSTSLSFTPVQGKRRLLSSSSRSLARSTDPLPLLSFSACRDRDCDAVIVCCRAGQGCERPMVLGGHFLPRRRQGGRYRSGRHPRQEVGLKRTGRERTRYDMSSSRVQAFDRPTGWRAAGQVGGMEEESVADEQPATDDGVGTFFPLPSRRVLCLIGSERACPPGHVISSACIHPPPTPPTRSVSSVSSAPSAADQPEAHRSSSDANKMGHTLQKERWSSGKANVRVSPDKDNVPPVRRGVQAKQTQSDRTEKLGVARTDRQGRGCRNIRCISFKSSPTALIFGGSQLFTRGCHD